MNICWKHSNSDFAYSFDFHCLTNFAKKHLFVVKVSLYCELLCKLSIYTLKSDQWKTIWWAKIELECLPLIFIYSNSKFKVTCKNADFECRYFRTHTEEKPSENFKHYIRLFAFFSWKTSTKLPSWVLWRLPLLTKASYVLQNGSSNTKNAKSRVRQSQVLVIHNPFVCS